MFKHPYHARVSERGFTLVELAMVVLILGLITRGVIAFIQPLMEESMYKTTIERQQKIARSLANYAQQHYALPCPGAPNATDIGEPRATCTTAATLNGIVPFVALGLSQQDVVDGYGAPFSYGVALEAVTPNLGQVYNNCRSDYIWNNGVSGTNYNGPKAAFCCGALTPAFVMTVASDIAYTDSLVPVRSDGGGSLADRNTMGGTPNINQRLSYVAYVLISHGRNKYGAFVFGNAARRGGYAYPGFMAAEAYNLDDDAAFRYLDMPRNDATGINYFDDIVLWRTQEQVLGEFSNESCAIP